MTSNPHFICLLFVLVTLLHGCSSNGRIGAPGRGGAATANVAGLKIEAQPSGSDGGDVSINSNEGGIDRVSISGVEVVVNEVSKVRLLNCGGHIDHRNIGVSRHRPDAFWCRNRDPRYLGKIADPARRVRDVSSQVKSYRARNAPSPARCLSNSINPVRRMLYTEFRSSYLRCRRINRS